LVKRDFATTRRKPGVQKPEGKLLAEQIPPGAYISQALWEKRVRKGWTLEVAGSKGLDD